MDKTVKQLCDSFTGKDGDKYDDQTNGLLGGNNLNSIPKDAFNNSYKISYIIGFNNVKTINANAFKNMKDLKYVYRVRQPEVYWK